MKVNAFKDPSIQRSREGSFSLSPPFSALWFFVECTQDMVGTKARPSPQTCTYFVKYMRYKPLCYTLACYKKLIILNQTQRHGLHVIPLFFFFFNLEFKCRMSDLYFNKMRQDLKFKDAKQQTVVSRHFLIICCFCN